MEEDRTTAAPSVTGAGRSLWQSVRGCRSTDGRATPDPDIIGSRDFAVLLHRASGHTHKKISLMPEFQCEHKFQNARVALQDLPRFNNSAKIKRTCRSGLNNELHHRQTDQGDQGAAIDKQRTCV